MAVIVHLHTYGTTPEQYEEVWQQVAVAPSAREGVISQMGGPTIDGFCLATVFRTREMAEHFVSEKLSAALDKAGVKAEAELVPSLELDED